MRNDSSLSTSEMPKTNKPYPFETLQKMFSIGVSSGMDANFELDKELSESEIGQIAQLCSSTDGVLTRYHQWFCPAINSWRLCLAYEKK